jgi:hypothetical protein
MFERILISVDGAYASAPMSRSVVWLVSSRLGKGAATNSRLAAVACKPGKLCQAEFCRMPTKTGE